MITLRCNRCKSRHLAIQPEPDRAVLVYQDCDRVLRSLTQYQAEAFARHLPQLGAIAAQLELLEGQP